jgi:hypothetical protein
MIYKRVAARLAAQDWVAITIELAIVVVGVFVGTWVADWNQARVEAGETRRMLINLKPELENSVGYDRTIENYYVLTRKYATTAFAGWRRDPRVSDRDFVIAAYQASQTNYEAMDTSGWAQAFGAERVSKIDDTLLQRDIGRLMSINFSVIEQELFTDYRKNVREVISEDIQDAIREKCGDRRNAFGANALPANCSLDLPNSRFAESASALRRHPELVGQLRLHFAAVAAYLGSLKNVETISNRAIDRIDALKT